MLSVISAFLFRNVEMENEKYITQIVFVLFGCLGNSIRENLVTTNNNNKSRMVGRH